NAERDDVGERVEFEAERALGAGQPRDSAIEHIERDRQADEERRGLKLLPHRVHDARVAAEHVSEREQARQQIDATAATAAWSIQISLRSFDVAASRRYAGRNRPRVYATRMMRPDAGMRLTWTSIGDRKMLTCCHAPGGAASATAGPATITRPSAGATTSASA